MSLNLPTRTLSDEHIHFVLTFAVVWSFRFDLPDQIFSELLELHADLQSDAHPDWLKYTQRLELICAEEGVLLPA